MRGGEKATGGGRKETAGGGCPRGRAGAEGAGVVTGRVTGGVLAAPMEGGGHGRLGAMPWLPVKEDGMYSGVSLFLYYYYF